MAEIKPTTEQDLYLYDEEFRNTIATVDAQGKRIWIYPKKPSGYYHRLRIAVSVLLLSLFFAGPFIEYHDRPFFLFNFFESKFILFGQAFWPQDFFLLALTLIIFFIFVALFTVSFGRIWCGWACPQTLFMEMVFRKIEYWIEGDANDQRKLDKAPWNFSKALKKISKQAVFMLISIAISHVTMAYLIGLDSVRAIIQQPPSEHWAGFTGLIAFTGIFYGVFAGFREQACIAVCPYGRLQGVLLVKESIVVAYDWLRGEPRGKIRKSSPLPEKKTGDCIDCKLCVHVCPTGIDIRNGTQLECVNCTACMDACDDVMVKIGKPKGLIRYSSVSAIAEGKQKLFTSRVAGYCLVLVTLVSVLSYLVFTREDVETTILKAPGTLYARSDDGQITNLYQMEFVNKTFEDISLQVKVESPAEASLMRIGGGDVLVPKEGMIKGLFMMKIPAESMTSMKITVDVGIYNNGERISNAKVKFIGPMKSTQPSPQ